MVREGRFIVRLSSDRRLMLARSPPKMVEHAEADAVIAC